MLPSGQTLYGDGHGASHSKAALEATQPASRRLRLASPRPRHWRASNRRAASSRCWLPLLLARACKPPARVAVLLHTPRRRRLPPHALLCGRRSRPRFFEGTAAGRSDGGRLTHSRARSHRCRRRRPPRAGSRRGRKCAFVAGPPRSSFRWEALRSKHRPNFDRRRRPRRGVGALRASERLEELGAGGGRL